MEGSTNKKTITSRVNGTAYPLDIYLPPASAGSRANLPIVYALDGESRFAELANIAESTHSRFIIVAIGNEAQRARDYVPVNTCTAGGGGNAAFLDFIRLEPLQDRHYTGLVLAAQAYAGGHIGMIPAAFTDAIRFAFPSTN